MNKYRLFLTISAVVVMALYSAALCRDFKSCSDSGGTMVRGLFWFKCVDKK